MLLEQPPTDQEAGPSSSAPDERHLTRAEAARYLGLPVSTIYQWARSGRLPCLVTLGGHLRFSKADLDTARAQPRARRRTSTGANAGPSGQSEPGVSVNRPT